MFNNPRKTLGITLALSIILILGIYVLFQAKNLILGPQITITEPADGVTVSFNVVSIKGIARNISEITLDDSPIFIDTKGVFAEKLIVPPGYSIIKLSAQDRFGRKKTTLLHIVYTKEAVTIPDIETTTGTSTKESTASSTKATTSPIE